MPRSEQIVTIKINIFNAGAGAGKVGQAKDGATNTTLFERTLHTRKEDFLSIKSKDALLKYINTKISSDLLPKESNQLNFTRKSKKHKCFIPLDNEEDFKSLGRSLKVKNHVKLNVEVLPLSQVSSPSSTTSSLSSSSSEGTKTTPTVPTATDTTATAAATAAGDPGSNPIASIDFAKLGDALLEATLEHFKDFFIENRPKEAGTNANTPTQRKEPVAASGEEQEEDVVVHANIACDRCCPDDFVTLKGVRYCCLVCSNYDLCAECESKQQAGKLIYGTHSYLHPMVKVTKPDSFSRDLFSNKFNVFDKERSDPFPNSKSNDIIYDIPLSSCSADNRFRLETLLQSEGFERFIKDVDGIIDRNDKYLQLLSILDANGYKSTNKDDMHKILQDCIDTYLLKKAFEESAVEESAVDYQQSEDDVKDFKSSDGQRVEGEFEGMYDATINLSLGSTMTKLSLQLVNESGTTISDGDWHVVLVDGKGKKYSTVVKSAVVKGSQVKYYKLDAIPQDFVIDDNATLLVIAPNVVLTSVSVTGNKFLMKITNEDARIEHLMDPVDTCTINTDKKLIDEFELVNDNAMAQAIEQISVSYKIQSGSILNIELQNKSNTTFSCADLKIVAYLQEEKVVELVFHKPHNIKPGCSSKFNLTLENPFTKFPLRMEFHFNDNKATCTFSEGEKQSSLMLLSEQGDSTSAIPHKGDSELLDDNEAARLVSTTQSASFHSMRLPVLARESVDLSEFMDASNGSGADKEDQNEYDVLDDEVEIDSDYEILSLASTDSY